MRTVKLLANMAGTSPSIADRWYLSDGAKAIGPIGLDLIARGLEAGKVPIGSYVRHEAWRVWRPLAELAEVEVDPSIPTPPHHPAHAETIPGHTDDVTMPGRPIFPEEIVPADALAGAADIEDALLLCMNAAILRTHADAAIVHILRPEGPAILYAHGPFARTLIGEVMQKNDPALQTAETGRPLIAEPTPGPLGTALLERLLHLGVACEAACLLPIVVHQRLTAMLELGRVSPRFKASELAAVEALIEALTTRAESDHWAS